MEPPLATNADRWNLSCLRPPIHGVHLDPEVGRRLVSRQIALFHLGSLTYVSAPRSPSGRSQENLSEESALVCSWRLLAAAWLER